jgi:hypothetical protein
MQVVGFILVLFVSGCEYENLLFVCYVKQVGSRRWVAKGTSSMQGRGEKDDVGPR